jgi:hypothetical protein
MDNARACILKPRRRWILAALLHCAACGKSPVDAIVFAQDGSAPDTGSGTGTGTGTGTGDPCTDGVATAAAGEFRLRALPTGQCLAVGGSTTVLGNPAFDTAMADDCLVAGEVWQLIPSASLQGAFEVRSLQQAYNLDIEMAQTADGTPAILFSPTSLANQRFYFAARRTGVFALVPAHIRSPFSCVSSAPPFPAIFKCDVTLADQEWQLIPASCP